MAEVWLDSETDSSRTSSSDSSSSAADDVRALFRSAARCDDSTSSSDNEDSSRTSSSDSSSSATGDFYRHSAAPKAPVEPPGQCDRPFDAIANARVGERIGAPAKRSAAHARGDWGAVERLARLWNEGVRDNFAEAAVLLDSDALVVEANALPVIVVRSDSTLPSTELMLSRYVNEGLKLADRATASADAVTGALARVDEIERGWERRVREAERAHRERIEAVQELELEQARKHSELEARKNALVSEALDVRRAVSERRVGAAKVALVRRARDLRSALRVTDERIKRSRADLFKLREQSCELTERMIEDPRIQEFKARCKAEQQTALARRREANKRLESAIGAVREAERVVTARDPVLDALLDFDDEEIGDDDSSEDSDD